MSACSASVRRIRSPGSGIRLCRSIQACMAKFPDVSGHPEKNRTLAASTAVISHVGTEIKV